MEKKTVVRFWQARYGRGQWEVGVLVKSGFKWDHIETRTSTGTKVVKVEKGDYKILTVR